VPEAGSPTWIRTTIHGSKGRCPTVRRSGKRKITTILSLAHRCYNMPGRSTSSGSALNGSQSWPVPGPDFKPGVRCFAARVGSTPTGFRQINTLGSLLYLLYRNTANCRDQNLSRLSAFASTSARVSHAVHSYFFASSGTRRRRRDRRAWAVPGKTDSCPKRFGSVARHHPCPKRQIALPAPRNGPVQKVFDVDIPVSVEKIEAGDFEARKRLFELLKIVSGSRLTVLFRKGWSSAPACIAIGAPSCVLITGP
jgi:hypothetical protein